MSNVVEETVTGVRVVKAFGQEERENRRLEAKSAQTVEIALRAELS